MVGIEKRIRKFCRCSKTSCVKYRTNPVQNEITILQAENEGLVEGASRPDLPIGDFKVSSWNKLEFPGWRVTYVDIKAPLDPEVIFIKV